ncbi:MAG: hypothetical protein V3T05_12235, partial [Myxococcota bacterium]
GAEPDLSEAQAYDTASMVKWLLTANAPKDRAAFRQGLLKMVGYVGSTGTMRFDETGEVQKELRVLTITGGSRDRSIRLWEPDADRPRG